MKDFAKGSSRLLAMLQGKRCAQLDIHIGLATESSRTVTLSPKECPMISSATGQRFCPLGIRILCVALF